MLDIVSVVFRCGRYLTYTDSMELKLQFHSDHLVVHPKHSIVGTQTSSYNYCVLWSAKLFDLN